MAMCRRISLRLCHEPLPHDSRSLHRDRQAVEVSDCYDHKTNFVGNICSLVYSDSHRAFAIILDLLRYFAGKQSNFLESVHLCHIDCVRDYAIRLPAFSHCSNFADSSKMSS